MKQLVSFCALTALFCLASGAQNLSTDYPFRATLLENGVDTYELFWRFDRDLKSITFAVRVNTTGWVGFGLSPNGEMPGSDVVIGWVDSNQRGYLDDRFALERDVPPIDPVQNWFLLSAKEDNGFTVLEFTRDWITCDKELDRVIDGGTARIVFSWSDVDPIGNNPIAISAHGPSRRGTKSINLLGENQDPPLNPPGSSSFRITVTNVTIPSNQSTTYWCAAVRLPEVVRNQTQYIYKFSPALTPHDFEHVHHMLLFLCINDLPPSDRNYSGDCFTASREVQACSESQLIGGWAVGGEGLIYPEDVAFPIGGPNTPQYIVVELHYDNPNLRPGVVDSSGLEFFYVGTPRKQDAGIMFIGHRVTWNMIIPPNAERYRVVGMCVAECTQKFIPETGIRVFANNLHTHLVGSGLSLKVIRSKHSTCSRSEELRPVDENPLYDFDFQQFTVLEEEFTILPGDIILLECNYTSKRRTGVTLGGYSTTEEMCFTFSAYYPRVPVVGCISFPSSLNLEPFVENYVPMDKQAPFASVTGQSSAEAALNTLQWTNEQVQGFQKVSLSGYSVAVCSFENGSVAGPYVSPIPKPDCEYQAPDECTGFMPTSCCERALGSDGGAPPTTPVSLLLVVLMACIVALSSVAGV